METNPIISNKRNIYFYLLLWVIIIASSFLLLNLALKTETITALTDSIVFNIILSGLGLSFWYSTRYISFENTSLYMITLNHFIGSVFVSALWLFSGYLVMTEVFGYGEDYRAFFMTTLPWRFLIGILIYFVITSFYYLIIYYSGFQERKLA